MKKNMKTTMKKSQPWQGKMRHPNGEQRSGLKVDATTVESMGIKMQIAERLGNITIVRDQQSLKTRSSTEIATTVANMVTWKKIMVLIRAEDLEDIPKDKHSQDGANHTKTMSTRHQIATSRNTYPKTMTGY